MSCEHTVRTYTWYTTDNTCTDPIVTTLPPTRRASATHPYAQCGCGRLCLSDPAVRIPPSALLGTIFFHITTNRHLTLRACAVYIPGLSELPLGNRLLVLLVGPFRRFFVFSLSLGTFCFVFFPLFSSVPCACVYSEHGTASERGTVAVVSGWWRVEGRLQGAPSPFSWLSVACAPTNEGSMNALCLTSWCGSGFTM